MSAIINCADPVDAVIVGTGAGGAPVAARLSQAGLRVVAIEAGRHFAPQEHTPDETGADIYWLDERLSAGKAPTAFGANNSGRGVGGSMLHWGAFCPRPDPRDLKLHTLTGKGADWPVEHRELTAYIEQVEAVIGVAGPAQYPWDDQRSYAYPPARRNAPAQAMARGCAMLGITASDGPAALVTRDREQQDWGLRQACVNCGACHQGCRNAAKTSMDTTYLPQALAAGLEIRSEAQVHDIERDRAGRVSAVIYRHGGRDYRQPCKALFLCAGGVETPRLLLHTGIANSSGQVGRNFMAHVATQVWGTFDAEMRMNRGYPSSLITEDMLRPENADFAGGYLIQSLGVQPLTLGETLSRSGIWGERLTRLLDGYHHLGGIGINGDCLPSDDNRLTLEPRERDALGVPRARIDFSYGENEARMDAHARKTMCGIWEAAGASDIFALARSAHTIGTCRMGEDPRSSVVDPAGRSHDIENLFICDNSVFPSALAANPALTIMALALRSADTFLGQAGPEKREARPAARAQPAECS